MQILGLNKTTLLDYPGHVAATIFTGGCNFRCPFCHNKGIILDTATASTSYTPEEVLAFLTKRQNVLAGVCITGGEPTLQADLADFIRRIKELGYLVKLDTNGYRPSVLQYLLDEQLLDFVAMDLKNSPGKYVQTTGVAHLDVSLLKESVEILLHASIPYEFRTTIVKELHDHEDIIEMGKWIQGAKAYYLQSYTDSEQVLCPGYHAHTKETLEEYLAISKKWIPNAQLRGIE